jgi:hypothetical protein
MTPRAALRGLTAPAELSAGRGVAAGPGHEAVSSG